MIEKVAYAIANPVAAGLVQRAADWPGLTIQPSELGRTSWTAARPKHFFDPKNPNWPPHATLHLSPLPTADMSEEETRAAVAEEVLALEAQARVDVLAEGKHFLGARKVASLSPLSRAKSKEPPRSLNPTLAVGRRARDVLMAGIAKLRDFRARYREAFKAWRSGVRNALFPPGTWLMRVLHDVKCGDSDAETHVPALALSA
jgi:putative transposase